MKQPKEVAFLQGKLLFVLLVFLLAYSITVNYSFAQTLPKVSITDANNSSRLAQSTTTNVIAIDNEAASMYVEIFANTTPSFQNKSYGLQQNNTETARGWCGGGCTQDGIYIYYARAYDNDSNNVSEGNMTIIIDSQEAPVVTASAQMHINQTVTNASWVANFTLTENFYYGNYSIEIDSINYTPTGNASANVGLHGMYITRTFTLSAGNHTVKAYANDSAGEKAVFLQQKESVRSFRVHRV